MFKNKDTEIILTASGFAIAFLVWVVSSIYTVQAKADRVIAVEEKVDYIYKYILEKSK